ncbi:MAG: ATP-binding protein [Thermoleophilaceae bacterium]
MSLDPHLHVVLETIYDGGRAASHESETLDFEQDDREGDKATLTTLTYASICFANAIGGQVVLGVADRRAGPDAFVGTRLSVDAVRQRIWETSDPGLTVDVRDVRFKTARLLVVQVPESSQLHAGSGGRAPRRIAAECRNMTPQEQARLREDRNGVDWSARPSERNPDDVSPGTVETALENLARHRDSERQVLARLAPADLLSQLGAVRADGRLTRAGETLFCPSADGSDRLVYIYKETPGGEPIDIHRFSGPLLEAFESVPALVAARRRLEPITLASGQQIQIEDFPHLAVREALSNAVLHRDYNLGGHVQVTHSPEAFEVTSPGPLVAGVTNSNILTHESKPRNAALAKAGRLLGIAEEVGTGVDRMYRELLSSGKAIPVIEAELDRVRVTFIGRSRSARIPAYIAQLPKAEREDVDTLLVLAALCEQRTVDAASMAPRLQKPADSAQIVLERLSGRAVAVIEPTRGTVRRARPKYRLREEALQALGPAVAYHQRRPVDELDRKVIAHVREYDRITNKTVRNIFTVDVHRARAILADLVKRGLLVKTSRAQRGPGVEYGPGANFPRAKRRRRSPKG